MSTSTKPGKKLSHSWPAEFIPSENDLDRKSDETTNAIAILDATIASDRETYSNLVTTVASLTTNLFSENKNLVAALRDNARLERLLGQCRLGGRTSKKTGIGGYLLGTYY